MPFQCDHTIVAVPGDAYGHWILMQEYVKERQGDPSTKPPPPNPLMMGMDAGGYVLKAVGTVKVVFTLVSSI